MLSNNIKILLIEDDDFLRRMYISKFDAEGFQVSSADNGLLGFKKACEEIPNIILLDMMLPEMTGLQVLEKLKENQETKDIPVVVLTNSNSGDEINRAKSLGAKDYLIKAHLTPSEVLAKVKEYIQPE